MAQPQDDDTISIVSAQEEPEPSFLPDDFHHILRRDLCFERTLLFDHICNARIKNPMVRSDDVDLPSFRECIYDLISSKQAWCDAIEKQCSIIASNKKYLKDSFQHLTLQYMNNADNDYVDEGSTNYPMYMARINQFRETLGQHSTFVSAFKEMNRAYLTPEHAHDADEPLDIFQIRLPIWYNELDGRRSVNWLSLYDVLTNVLFTEESRASPVLPSRGSFSCTRYVSRIFRNRVIANHTPIQHTRGSQSFRKIMTNIRNRMTFSIERGTAYQTGIFLRNHQGRQYSGIGKVRYTLSVILRWIELTHYLLFRDQISHSILHYFYRNIQTMPRTISQNPMMKRYVHANVRVLTNDTMPDESVDPVLLVPFTEGQEVYKMKCCHKDFSKETIEGIIQSGRTPKCPMCRSALFTSDTSHPVDPTYEESVDIEIYDPLPAYIESSHVPEESYIRILIV